MWEKFYFHFQWNVGPLKPKIDKFFIILVILFQKEFVYFGQKISVIVWVLIEAASLYKWMKMHNLAGFSYGLNIIILILYTCILLLLFSPYVVSDSLRLHEL